MKVYCRHLKKARLLTIFFVSLACSDMSLAQSNRHAVIGAGASNCGAYLDASSDRELSMIYASWAQGYLSGINVTQHSLTNDPFVLLPDPSTLRAYIYKYCRDNPLEMPSTGVTLLFFELRNRQKLDDKKEVEK